MKTKKKLKYVAGVGLILVFLLVIFSTTSSSGSNFINPYKSVSEIVENPNNYINKQVQVQGYVVKDTIAWAPKNLNFTLTDGKNTIPIVYYGVIPATFPLGAELDESSRIDVVAIGRFDGEKVVADQLLVKCPSKYQSQL